MDKAKIIEYGKWIVIHGIAWILAYKLGFEKTVADEYAGTIGTSLAAVVLAGWSIYDSYKGRKKVKG